MTEPVDITVTSLWGCSAADIQVTPGEVTVIAGLNESGKTSLVRALGVLMSRNTNPLGLLASERLRLTARDGKVDGAYAALDMGDKLAEWIPAKDQLNIDDDAFPQMPNSVVSGALLEARGKEARAAWQDIIGAEISDELLSKRLDEILVEIESASARKTVIAKIVKLFAAEHFTAAEQVAAENSLNYKHRWNEVVAELDGQHLNYGKQIAAKFIPKNWTAECEGLSLTAARQNVEQARANAEKFAGVNYLTEQDAKRLADETKRKPKLSKELTEVQSKLAKTQADFFKAEAKLGDAQEAVDQIAELARAAADEREKLERAQDKLAAEQARIEKIEEELADVDDEDTDGLMTCPVCSSWLALDAKGELEQVSVASKGDDTLRAQLAAAVESRRHWRDKIKELEQSTAGYESDVESPESTKRQMRDLELAEASARNKRAALSKLQQAEQDAKVALRTCAEVIERFAGFQEKSAEIEAQTHDANEALRVAEQRCQAVECRERASEQHRLVVMWERVRHLLSSKGIRAEVVATKADRFNSHLAKLSSRASWSAIELDTTSWTVKVDGQDIRLASSSAKWRAAALISLAVSYMYKFPLAVLDGADILFGVDEAGDTFTGLLVMAKRFAKVAEVPLIITTANMNVDADYVMRRGVLNYQSKTDKRRCA